MFSSLRARLWISYAVLIAVALGVMAIALGVYLWQNPVLSRQALTRLRTVETGLLNRWEDYSGAEQLRGILDRAARAFDVRILLFEAEGGLLFDSAVDGPAIKLPREPLLDRDLLTARDASGAVWLFTRHQMRNGTILMVATPRARAPVLNFLRDELMPMFMRGAGVALLLSLVLAFAIARWIADPLQHIVSATRHIPVAEAQPVPEQGPQEVRDLTRAFNAMIARVQNSQKSQRDFLANVSHELKTPLTSIQGFAQALLDGTAGAPEDQKHAAGVIFQESERMYRMVMDLLDLARLEGGTAEMKMAPVDLKALMYGIQEKFNLQARDKGIQLVADCPENLPVVVGDGDRLAQVLTNLVDNALKHTPTGGQVMMKARPSTDAVVIHVADTGAGIPSEALPHIFDRFYQADISRPGIEKRGAGLGLAIVQEIVTAHGGRISVRSQVGQGTTFFVQLPISPSHAATRLQRKN